MQKLAWVLALTILVCMVPDLSPAAPSITNGSFEAEIFSAGGTLDLGGSNTLTGWTTNANGIYPWGLPYPNDFSGGPTPYGNQWVIVGDFGEGGTYIQQAVSGFTVGASYKLSFALSSELPSATGALVEVSFPTGSTTNNQTFEAPPIAAAYWDTWSTFSIDFVATSSEVTIRFSGLAGPGYDAGIDNVSITPNKKTIFTGVFGGTVDEVFDDPNRQITTYSDSDIAAYVVSGSPSCAGAICSKVDDGDLRAIAKTDLGGITSIGYFTTSLTSHATLNTPGNVTTLTSDISSSYKSGDHVFLAGHSDGGGDVQDVLQRLQTLGIPVLLSGHFDSIEVGNDATIPSNTKVAMGYFQKQGARLTRGEDKLKASDKKETTVSNTGIKDAAGPADPLTDSNAYHRNMDNDPRTWTPILSGMRTSEASSLQESPATCVKCSGSNQDLLNALGGDSSPTDKRLIRMELARRLSEAGDLDFILDAVATRRDIDRLQLLDLLSHTSASGGEERIETEIAKSSEPDLTIALVYTLRTSGSIASKKSLLRAMNNNGLSAAQQRQLATAIYLALSESIDADADADWIAQWAGENDLSTSQAELLARTAAHFPRSKAMDGVWKVLDRKPADAATKAIIKSVREHSR